ncbi:hypothetical protein N8J89_08085 [Crossiella sp. CA-258035]|uniref:VG15 protein n=1 Tax=Crossiella sp. CA-258035 TaxID=2981138 RepID=UPI0024BC3EF0|nr:hypothetical protein [Crossiella sp. CA-258035]WHT21014.1 hypothetical protein N8J89_08085 [Crossiella sp. CA-258035]
MNSALGLLSEALRRGVSDPATWRDSVAAVAERLLVLQVAAAALADDYVTDVLEAQGADPSGETEVNPEGFADFTDGGGSLLSFLVFAGNSVYREATQERLSAASTRQRVEHVTTAILMGGMQDTGRSAVHSAMFARPSVTRYVRMLRPPSCARCAILAGREYRASVAFKRHKRCDCRHIPQTEDTGDWTTRPSRYFKSLSREEQDRIFTKSGAEAIRLGGVKDSSMNQIVNASKGMQTVTSWGRELSITLEGVTQRGLFGRYIVQEDGSLRRRDRTNPLERNTLRLMPDQIFQLAEQEGWDRAEVLRRLRRYAYVL